MKVLSLAQHGMFVSSRTCLEQASDHIIWRAMARMRLLEAIFTRSSAMPLLIDRMDEVADEFQEGVPPPGACAALARSCVSLVKDDTPIRPPVMLLDPSPRFANTTYIFATLATLAPAMAPRTAVAYVDASSESLSRTLRDVRPAWHAENPGKTPDRFVVFIDNADALYRCQVTPFLSSECSMRLLDELGALSSEDENNEIPMTVLMASKNPELPSLLMRQAREDCHAFPMYTGAPRINYAVLRPQ